jgi:hypothetical protein
MVYKIKIDNKNKKKKLDKINSGYPSFDPEKNVSCVNFIFSKNINTKIEKHQCLTHCLKCAEFLFSKNLTFSMLVAKHKMVF